MRDQNIIARMETYKALAGCYFPPDDQLTKNAEELARHVPEWVPQARNPSLAMLESLPRDEQGRDALRVEHAKLFFGPFEVLAPPLGSVYFHVHRMISHESSDDAADRYRQAGVTVPPNAGTPPDHVTAELEFMYYLLYHEHAARSLGHDADARDWQGRRTDFFTLHLGAWGPLFADRVVSFALTPFYKNLGLLTKSVLREEARLNAVRPAQVARPAKAMSITAA